MCSEIRIQPSVLKSMASEIAELRKNSLSLKGVQNGELSATVNFTSASRISRVHKRVYAESARSESYTEYLSKMCKQADIVDLFSPADLNFMSI